MALRFAGVGLIGFAIDAALLRVGLGLGLTAASARVISLICAMQVTFAINGLVVFRCLTARKFARQWFGYMTTNRFGNFCNYWIFVTLVSTHWRVVSNPYLALIAGAATAYLINYAGARLLVFGKGRAAAVLRRETRSRVCEGAAPERSPAGDVALR